MDIADKKLAGTGLGEPEQLFAGIINFLPDATFVIDRDGFVIAWNRAIEEMTGIPAEKMLGKGNYEYAIPFYGNRRPLLIDMVFVSDDILEKAFYHIFRKEGDTIIAETTLPQPMGSIVYLWGKASPLYDEQGNRIGAIESIRDITDRKRAELALKQSEDKYRTLFENSGSPLMIADEDTTIQLVNREFEKISGYSRDEINGRKSWTGFIATKDDLAMMKEYHRLRRVGPELAPVTYESRIINRNGDIRDVIMTVVLIPATRQSLAAFVDITDRKKAEEALRRTGERFRRIASNLPGIVYQFYAMDTGEWGMHFVDGRSSDVYGLNPEPLDTWFDRFTFCIAPEDRERWVASIRNVVSRVVPWEFEGTFVRPDGGEMYIRGMSQPLRLTNETVWNGILLDVTDRRQAEIALEDAKEFAENIIETANAIIVGLDNEGRIIIFNRAAEKITGYTRAELDGRSWFDVIVPKDRFADVHEEFDRLMSGGIPRGFENPILTKGGDVRYISWQNNEIRKQGQITGTISIGIDITERRKAEKELTNLYTELEKRVVERTAELSTTQAAYRQANEKLNLLSSITRHDINNQLSILQGFLALLSLKIADSADAEMLRKAQMAGQAIQHQIAFTKDYQDIGVKSPRWQNIGDIISKVTNELPHEHIAIESHLGDLEVYADPLMEKVVYNLIDNAIRYGETITKIRFSYKESPECMKLLYDDNGVGIPAEDKLHLFTKGFGKNTGLGLFLSRQILGITGLTIQETGEPGMGARFEITLPGGMWRFTGKE